jgi:hypothetical protein
MNRMPEAMWAIWEAGNFVGPNRPITRALISKNTVRVWGDSPYRNLLFADHEGLHPLADSAELPNVQQVTITRRLGQDAATMSLTLLNQVPATVNDDLDATHGADLGPTRRELRDLGTPGAYTFGRGMNREGSENVSASYWGHAADSRWADMIIPNRVIYTFQGYGTDGAAVPQDDTNLIQTGTWLIDKVNYAAGGTIQIECRDLAKLLIEQRLYPPIIPMDDYPLKFCADHTTTKAPEDGGSETEPGPEPGSTTTVGANVATFHKSSVDVWLGFNASVCGHRGSHAFDGDSSTYWLSIGNVPSSGSFAFEWIQALTNGEPINRVKFRQGQGGYRVYVGVIEDGAWQGSNVVPYNPGSVGKNGSDKPYVHTEITPSSTGWVTIDLPRTYQADKVRLTFTRLNDSSCNPTYPHRVWIHEMEVMLASTEVIEDPPEEGDSDPEDLEVFTPGNLTNNDYTDIIKLLCAWSGFFWPNGSAPDPVLQDWAHDTDISNGRVWGDFMYSGAWPVDPPCIPPSFWDNKSVMDGINQIKEILGFVMYVDSHGGVVWRPPNIWKLGNYISGTGYVGADAIREVSETNVLMDYGVEINDENIRSEIIVVSSEDPSLYGSYAPTFAPTDSDGAPSAVSDLELLGGQQRIMLVPNYPFLTQEEVNKFAYLVSLWIHWSYRKSKFKIPGNPAFEPDDQVRIKERVTSESYVHYVLGTTSTMDMKSGSWTMDIDTHWLGTGPEQEWMVEYSEMTPALYKYLVAIGQIDEDGDTSELPDDFFDEPDPVVPTDPITVDDDFGDLFPDPPTYVPIPTPVSTEDPISGQPGTGGSDDEGWVTPPGPGEPGSSLNCSNSAQYSKWGNRNTNINKIVVMYDYRIANPNNLEPTHPGQLVTKRTRVNRGANDAFKALFLLCAEFGLVITSTSGAANRQIAGSNTWSNHSWGLAVDINPDAFPRPSGSPSLSSYLSGRPQADKLYNVGQYCDNWIRDGDGARIFRWGGWWNHIDPMHFEVCGNPNGIRAGVFYKGTLVR